MPAFYLEMRINPIERIRWMQPVGPRPDSVKMFLGVRRAGTDIRAGGDGARIDMSYENGLSPALAASNRR